MRLRSDCESRVSRPSASRSRACAGFLAHDRHGELTSLREAQPSWTRAHLGQLPLPADAGALSGRGDQLLEARLHVAAQALDGLVVEGERAPANEPARADLP